MFIEHGVASSDGESACHSLSQGVDNSPSFGCFPTTCFGCESTLALVEFSIYNPLLLISSFPVRSALFSFFLSSIRSRSVFLVRPRKRRGKRCPPKPVRRGLTVPSGAGLLPFVLPSLLYLVTKLACVAAWRRCRFKGRTTRMGLGGTPRCRCAMTGSDKGNGAASGSGSPKRAGSLDLRSHLPVCCARTVPCSGLTNDIS